MHTTILALVFVGTTLPVISLMVLAGSVLVLRTLPERRVDQLLAATMTVGIATTALALALLVISGTPRLTLDLGSLYATAGYHVDLRFLIDPLGLSFLLLDFLLTGLIGVMSARYLHQEPGFLRFFFLLQVFQLGIEFVAVGEGLDLVFVGWELVGLSSALLIAFFHQRQGPVRNGLRAFAIYRLTDVGLLAAVLTLHHVAHSTSLVELVTHELTGPEALMIGGLIVFGAMGKGAIVPFTGWLPRAMEGPTPSSAIFYGALSIHASPFLLIRVEPLIQAHVGLQIAVIALGLLTALHASMVGRTQTDIKSVLAYAAVAQAGLIWVEVGLGWTVIPIVHMIGHALLRTWQLIRSPSLLHDRHHLMVLAAGETAKARNIEQLYPAGLRRQLYFSALHRWHLDEGLDQLLRLMTTPFRWLDRLDRALGAPETVPGAAPKSPRPGDAS